MILGVGVDVVHLDGFRQQMTDGASTFVDGTFTRAERKTANGAVSGDPSRHLAARFAAKEAVIKAWSSANWGRAPMLNHLDLRDIEVVTDSFGRPAIVLHGPVAEAVATLGPVRFHISMSHDGPMATAYVVAERIEISDTDAQTTVQRDEAPLLQGEAL